MKECTIIINRVGQSKNVSRNGRMRIDRAADFKQTANNVVHALKTGDVNETLMAGTNYFHSICETMRELLQSRMIE